MKRNDSIRCSFIIIVLVMKCLRIIAHSFKKKDVFFFFNFEKILGNGDRITRGS